MASKTHSGFVCLLFLALFTLVRSFMDIEELQSITYGINILKEPIVIPETAPESAIVVTSRHGQQYQCDYPNHHQQKQQQEEEEKIALETGVVDLLKPLAQEPCLLKTKDWWTYEVCFGKHIRQYHMEDGRPKGDIMILGLWESDFDWNNATLRDARVRSKIASGRYHSQYYTNGSLCDLTKNGRQTEVRFLCENMEENYIARVDEPETCVYVITVHTPRLCSHPHLKSPTPTQPIPIVCAPLLTGPQYLLYQEHAQIVKQNEEEAAARAKAEKEKLEKELADAAAQKELANIEDGLAGSVNSILKKSLGKELKGKVTALDTGVPGDLPPGWDWKDLKDLEDLGKLMDPQGILSNMDMSNKGQKSESSKPVQDVQDSTKVTDSGASDDEAAGTQLPAEEEKTEEEEADEDLDDDIDSELGEFTKEVKTLREKQAMTQKRIQQIKERVKNVVTSQFKDIINEAQEEVGGEVNEDVALRQLSDSLNALMEKLEDTEKEMKNMDKQLDSMEETKSTETETMSTEKETVTDTDIKGVQETADKEGTEATGGVQAPPTTRQETFTGLKVADLGVSALYPFSKRKKGAGIFSGKEGEEEVRKVKDLHPAQQQQFEDALSHHLQKAGVDPNSVKVHVKIISSQGNDDDDEYFHVVSEEESSSFTNMIVAILGGSSEAVKEEKRHSSLEDSYNFVFDENAAEDVVHRSEATSSASDTGSHDTSSDNSDGSATSSDSSDSSDVSLSEAPSLPEQGI